MSKKLFSILFLAAVIFVSGCTTGGVGDRSNGLIITSFGPDLTEVEGGEIVFFIAEIENVGGARATGITADLIGLPDQWGTPGAQSLGELAPPEPGVQGEIATAEWQLTAPPSDNTITYPAEAIVDFGYATHVESLVRVATREWIRSLPVDQQDAELAKLGQVQTSPELGAIHTTVLARKGTVFAGSQFRVTLDIRNVGSGRPLNDQVSLSVSGMSCDQTGSITLIQGESRQVRCNVDVGGVTTWENKRIDIDLTYTYRIRAPTEITVLASPV